jgi:hypothetical protein
MKLGGLMEAKKYIGSIFLLLQLIYAVHAEPITDLDNQLRFISKNLQESTGAIFQTLVQHSDIFAHFPTRDNRIKLIAGDDQSMQATIVAQAKQSYPLMHSKVLTLIDAFLRLKKEHGSAIEKAVYASMTRESFIDRLLIKRPLMFMNPDDTYMLRDGAKGSGGFEAIGTTQEKQPLILVNYLSYDEMQIAALIGASTPTYFINNGSRNNRGIKAAKGTYEQEGVYCGLVGARFEKPGYMEWQHILVSPVRDIDMQKNNSIFSLWAALYDIAFPTYQQARSDRAGRYIPITIQGQECFFDTVIYKERMRLVIEPFLLDAQRRGIARHKKVYVHAVGLGLGVWQLLPQQAQLMLDVYADILQKRTLSEIADIDFSWFPSNSSLQGIKNGERFTAGHNNITIHFSQRNPVDRLVGLDSGKLLVAQYAWDGNAYPGNEYWSGALNASGDPAAACCSTIAELQNPAINPYFRASNMPQ